MLFASFRLVLDGRSFHLLAAATISLQYYGNCPATIKNTGPRPKE
jgi:hypothetical protein